MTDTDSIRELAEIVRELAEIIDMLAKKSSHPNRESILSTAVRIRLDAMLTPPTPEFGPHELACSHMGFYCAKCHMRLPNDGLCPQNPIVKGERDVDTAAE